MNDPTISTDLLNAAVRLFGLLLFVLINSAVVALTHHPLDERGAWAVFLRLLGRVSVLRHVDAPGTLHRPGARQPLPEWAESPPEGLRPLPRAPRSSSGQHLVGVLLFLPLALGACRMNLEASERALAGALQQQDQVVRDFMTWDRQHQQELVASSRSAAEARGKLELYRTARVRVRELLVRGARSLDAVVQALAGAGGSP